MATRLDCVQSALNQKITPNSSPPGPPSVLVRPSVIGGLPWRVPYLELDPEIARINLAHQFSGAEYCSLYPNVQLLSNEGTKYKFNAALLASASLVIASCLHALEESLEDCQTIITELSDAHLKLFAEFVMSGSIRVKSIGPGLASSFLCLGIDLNLINTKQSPLVNPISEKPPALSSRIKTSQNDVETPKTEPYLNIVKPVENILIVKEEVDENDVVIENSDPTSNPDWQTTAKQPEFMYGLNVVEAQLQIEENEYHENSVSEFWTKSEPDLTDKRVCLKDENGPTKHVCPHCWKEFNQSSGLTCHIERQHMQVSEEFKCDICSKCFSGKNLLTAHKSRVHNFKSYKLCGENVDTGKKQRNPPRNLETLKNEKGMLVCPDCGKEFNQPSGLTCHIERQHRQVSEEFKCDICSRCFSGKNVLTAHKSRVHKFKSYKLCGENVEKNRWAEHVKMHAGKKQRNPPRNLETMKNEKGMLVCPHCGKEFNQSAGLTFHIERQHSQVSEEFQCDVCSKCFPGKNLLKAHKSRAHTTDFRFCELCGKNVKKTCWTDHMGNKHTDKKDKRFTCKICDPIRGFFSKHAFQDHMNIHEGKKPHVCTLGCSNVAYANRSNLLGHIREFHKGLKRRHDKKR